MGEINSPLGKKTFESAPTRRFVVENEVDNGSPVIPSHEELAEMRRQKIEESSRISDSAKRRVEILMGIGRAHRNVTLGQYTFSLRSLKGKEQRQLALMTEQAQKDTTLMKGVFDIRDVSLAYSLYAVDGTDIDLVLDCANVDEEIKMNKKLSFLDELDDVILNRLYSEYTQMVKENVEKFSIKTDADVKEVVSDIKKSS